MLRLGKLSHRDGRTFARIDGYATVDEVVSESASQHALARDLTSILAEKTAEETTKESLVLARVGQGTFRTKVLQLWGNRCAVTGSTTRDVIRASHIKPWSESSNQERLDPYNGLPLTATLDALFDAGLISFDSSGKLLISQKLDSSERRIFGLSTVSLARKPSKQTAAYLNYHRNHCLVRD